MHDGNRIIVCQQILLRCRWHITTGCNIQQNVLAQKVKARSLLAGGQIGQRGQRGQIGQRGQSGDLNSPHFYDQAQRCAQGCSKNVSFLEQQITFRIQTN